MAEILKGTSGSDILKNSKSDMAIYGYAGNDTIRNYSSNVYISGGNDNDFIKSESYASNVTVHGDTGSDNIYVAGKNAQIYGESDNDSIKVIRCDNGYIDGGTGNDTISVWSAVNITLKGGKGNDYVELTALNNPSCVIAYNSGDGNDIITGFSDNDTLNITCESYSRSTVGKDVVITVENGKITLQGAASLSNLNIKGTKATSTTKTVTNSTKSPVTVGSAIKTINSSKRTTAVKITGNSLANTITGGSKNDTIYGKAGNDSILGNAGNDKLYGGKGNDTLTGGKGNDSLWGNAGKDTFIYAKGDGKDVIYGFDNTDMLKITGTFAGTYNKSKKEVYFKVGSTANAITPLH